jgi:hypothetical protein
MECVHPEAGKQRRLTGNDQPNPTFGPPLVITDHFIGGRAVHAEVFAYGRLDDSVGYPDASHFNGLKKQVRFIVHGLDYTGAGLGKSNLQSHLFPRRWAGSILGGLQ